MLKAQECFGSNFITNVSPGKENFIKVKDCVTKTPFECAVHFHSSYTIPYPSRAQNLKGVQAIPGNLYFTETYRSRSVAKSGQKKTFHRYGA